MIFRFQSRDFLVELGRTTRLHCSFAAAGPPSLTYFTEATEVRKLWRSRSHGATRDLGFCGLSRTSHAKTAENTAHRENRHSENENFVTENK